MNTTIELVNLWGAFEKQHPTGTIDEFCRQHLAHQQKKEAEVRLPRGLMPQSDDTTLMRLLGRIVKLHAIYTLSALEGTGIGQVEEFTLLNTIKFLKDPRKTEVIYACLHELSTGTDMLNRLKKQGLFTETDDKDDKRSKRLTLTAKGEKVLEKSYARIRQLATMMFHDLDSEDKKLCIQLVKGVEQKFAATWQEHRGRNFKDIYSEVVN